MSTATETATTETATTETATTGTATDGTAATTEATTAPFTIRGIDAHDADRLRRAGGIVRVADSSPGYPCRQCLRDADVGEELLLVSYDPFPAASVSPYRAAGPVFLHRAPCPPAPPTGTAPVQLTSRTLSLRAYDVDDMMTAGTVVAGADVDATLHALFADEAVARVHVHFAGPGCHAACVTRNG